MPIAFIASDFLDAHGRGYPRPQLRRRDWCSLNGTWDFAVDQSRRWQRPAEVEWQETISVPFSPEAPASGIGRTEFIHVCWYRRSCELEEAVEGQRWLLHFGAVDHAATVWVNAYYAGEHR